MKTLTFNYAKKDGSTSSRTLLAQVVPTDKYAGIDLSQLDASDAAEFIALSRVLHAEYIEKMQALQAHYDLTHNYRQFLASGMSNITEI